MTSSSPISNSLSHSRRKGVRVGSNYVEELSNTSSVEEPSTSSDHDTYITTSEQYFNITGKTGKDLVAISKREDIPYKYVKYGKSNAFSSINQSGCYATINQLAYQPSSSKVQDIMWAGSKFVNSKVPTSIPLNSLAKERMMKLEKEAEKSIYSSVQQEALLAAAMDPQQRALAKPSGCRPKADGGQEAQVGRKAVGEFSRACDKDFLKIGLRS